MVSVPSEGSVSASVCSVVNMVRSSMGGSGGRSIGGGAAGRSSAVVTGIGKLLISFWDGLVTVQFLLDLSGLSGEARVSHEREAGEVGRVHATGGCEVNHEVPGRSGGRSDCGSECNKDLEKILSISDHHSFSSHPTAVCHCLCMINVKSVYMYHTLPSLL